MLTRSPQSVRTGRLPPRSQRHSLDLSGLVRSINRHLGDDILSPLHECRWVVRRRVTSWPARSPCSGDAEAAVDYQHHTQQDQRRRDHSSHEERGREPGRDRVARGRAWQGQWPHVAGTPISSHRAQRRGTLHRGRGLVAQTANDGLSSRGRTRTGKASPPHGGIRAARIPPVQDGWLENCWMACSCASVPTTRWLTPEGYVFAPPTLLCTAPARS